MFILTSGRQEPEITLRRVMSSEQTHHEQYRRIANTQQTIIIRLQARNSRDGKLQHTTKLYNEAKM